MNPEAIPGSMARAFYWNVAPTGSAAASAEVVALLEAGVFPAGGLGLEHYQEAVAWHRVGRIGDAELAAVALIARLSVEAAATTGRRVLQRVGAPEVTAIRAHLRDAELPPVLELLVRHRLRGIKGMARLALLGWHVGLYPGILAMGAVTATELLAAQARGFRHVGIGLPEAGFATIDQEYPGGFIHHDLCHLAKFRGALSEPTVYAGQVGFFAAFSAAAALDPTLLEARSDLPPGMDLAVVATDTNGDVRLLLTLYLARRLARRAHDGGPLGAAARESLVAVYLVELGMDSAAAARAAADYDSDRGAFLSAAGPWFEARGRTALGYEEGGAPSPAFFSK
jgi:hypothetical protein